MILNAEKYLKLIKQATTKFMIFQQADNQSKKPTAIRQSGILLPSSYPFKSCQQINNNLSITHKITHQSLKQSINEWPKSCIGLILSQHTQENKIFYVYGTGTLIHKNIVLTSAQNVYCRRLHIQYTNIRFITGVSSNKCSGIYEVRRVHYKKQYTMQEYEKYDFAVLQLYDDLSDSCGYIRWRREIKPIVKKKSIIDNKKLVAYRYLIDSNQGQFILQSKLQQEEQVIGARFMKEKGNQYYIVSLSNRQTISSQLIQQIINQWTTVTRLELKQKYLQKEWEQILNHIPKDLNQIDLGDNRIGVQECKYLSRLKWTHLTMVDLNSNNISVQGCKYISQANWVDLITINLDQNKIDGKGCNYLRQANWKHLTKISLYRNNIDGQGCKYLSKADWKHLTTISLDWNNIGTQGCKYLSQASWTYLTTIILWSNNIGAQGCKYLKQANWAYLTRIVLWNNNIGQLGCKYLKQANWPHLKEIQLYDNKIIHKFDRMLLRQLWPNAKIYFDY